MLADSLTGRLGTARLAVVLLLGSLVAGVSCLVLRIIYNLFFHPLRRYPGPAYLTWSRFGQSGLSLSGEPHKRILDLHKKYGPVVRIAPNGLSFIRPDAWSEIMGHRKVGTPENGKDPEVYNINDGGIVASTHENHRRLRRILAHGFSAQAMLDQQPLIKHYVDLFIQRLHERGQNGTKALDMTAWLNYTTFDIIGDLSFGEGAFDCLKSSDYHPWVSLIFKSIKVGTFFATIRPFFRDIDKVMRKLLPTSINKVEENRQLVREKLKQRLEIKEPRPDFVQTMLGGPGKLAVTEHELERNAVTLVIAGSETTATTMSGTLFFLATNPSVLEKLTEEVRGAFTREDEIDLLRVQKLGYMLAVLNESMRMFPAVPVSLPRATPKGGAQLFGEYLPGNTSLHIFQYAMYHSPTNFTMPDAFIPERWLGDPRFENDHPEAFEPFSYGSRNCIGKNLAYAEMRLLLAKIIWNFDLEIDEGSKGWYEGMKVYTLWEKPALNIYLHPRKMD